MLHETDAQFQTSSATRAYCCFSNHRMPYQRLVRKLRGGVPIDPLANSLAGGQVVAWSLSPMSKQDCSILVL
jgi:hypothetical protein